MLGIMNLKFHSASPREISNLSVVFEPNSKFHSPQKDVFSKNFHKLGMTLNSNTIIKMANCLILISTNLDQDL